MVEHRVSIVINGGTCTQCGACVAVCTGRVFQEIRGQVQVVRPAECWECGHCVCVCPTDAIEHSAYPLDECPLLQADSLPALDSLVDALRERRSARVFLDQPVSRETVRELVNATRWAPSASNGQPVDWLVCDDPARIAVWSAQAVAVLVHTARLLRNPLLRPLLALAVGAEQVRKGQESAADFERLAQRQAQGEDPIFFGAPVVLVAHVPRDDYFGRDHAPYAAYNLMLAASRCGLGTCQIGYFAVALDRSRRLRVMLGLPRDRKAEVTLVLGHPKYSFRRVPSRRKPELNWTQ